MAYNLIEVWGGIMEMCISNVIKILKVGIVFAYIIVKGFFKSKEEF